MRGRLVHRFLRHAACNGSANFRVQCTRWQAIAIFQGTRLQKKKRKAVEKTEELKKSKQTVAQTPSYAKRRGETRPSWQHYFPKFCSKRIPPLSHNTSSSVVIQETLHFVIPLSPIYWAKDVASLISRLKAILAAAIGPKRSRPNRPARTKSRCWGHGTIRRHGRNGG